MFLGYQNNKIKFYTEQLLDETLYNLDKVEETEDIYVLSEDGTEYVLYNDEQKAKELAKVKELKLQEADEKAYLAEDNGYIIFKEAQFETNTTTANNLDKKRQFCILRGDTSALWLSKDNKQVELIINTEEPLEDDFVKIGLAVEGFKESLWNIKYLGYINQINSAETKEEVEAIEINYEIN